MLDPRHEHWTERRMGALPSPTLGPAFKPGRASDQVRAINQPQQGQAPQSQFALPAGAGAAASAAASFAGNAHAEYVAKVPAPFACKSVAEVKALADADRAKWVQWFMGSPAVAAYLDGRKKVTEAASTYLNDQAELVRIDLIIAALEGYQKKYYPVIANAKKELYPALEELLTKLNKQSRDVTAAASSAWAKTPGGSGLPTPFDLYEARATKYGSKLWAIFYWRFGNTLITPAEAGSVSQLSAVVPITPSLTLPVITLPACGPLPQKTVGFFLASQPQYWDTAGMGPKTLELVKFLGNRDKGGAFGKDPKTGEYQSYAVYKAVNDWIAANLMDPLKALSFAQVFMAKGTPYSIGWAKDEIGRQRLVQEGRKPGLAASEAAVAKADAGAKNLLKLLPEGFEQKMAASLADQMALLVLGIVKNGIAKMLAEAGAQDVTNNATLVQLSAYGAELQIASKAEYKDAVYFVLKAATAQADAIGEGVGGGQVKEGTEQAQGASADLDKVKGLADETGVQTVSPEEMAAAKEAAAAAQKALEDAAKKLKDQEALLQQIKDASKADYNYQTVTPTITSASPAKVPVAGGVQVAVQGLFFASGATVQLAGADVPTVFVSPSQLTITAPPASGPGAVDLTVTNPATEAVDENGTVFNKKAASSTLKAALTYEQPAQGGGLGLPALAAVAIGALALLRK